jgi:tetratricopeptide (TPR) repeat protein
MADDHFKLVSEGLNFHEARAYAKALPYFERACAAAPTCPTARYNRANTLHMLGRDRKALSVLLPILAASVDKLRDGCPDCGPQSLKTDAFFLLSHICRSRGQPGDLKLAVGLAETHLRDRRRGVRSVWTARHVRAELAAMRKELAAQGRACRAAASDPGQVIAKRRRRR